MSASPNLLDQICRPKNEIINKIKTRNKLSFLSPFISLIFTSKTLQLLSSLQFDPKGQEDIHTCARALLNSPMCTHSCCHYYFSSLIKPSLQVKRALTNDPLLFMGLWAYEKAPTQFINRKINQSFFLESSSISVTQSSRSNGICSLPRRRLCSRCGLQARNTTYFVFSLYSSI